MVKNSRSVRGKNEKLVHETFSGFKKYNTVDYELLQSIMSSKSWMAAKEAKNRLY